MEELSNGEDAGQSVSALNPKKRFELSQDLELRERLTIGFRRALNICAEKYPSIVGATLFGSQVKGTARTDSDIDASFIWMPSKEDVIIERRNKRGVLSFVLQNAHEIYDLIDATASEQTGISQEKISKDMRIVVVDNDIIDKCLLDFAQKHERKAELDTYRGRDYEGYKEYVHGLSPDSQDYAILNQGITIGDISKLFHLGMNVEGVNKLKGLRSYVLEKANELPEGVRDRLGKDICATLAFFEQRKDKTRQTVTPRSFDDLLKIYQYKESSGSSE